MKKSDGSDFSGHAELSPILALKVDDSDGADIDYAASINAEKTVITLDPSSDFPAGAVYVAVTGGYHDAAGNQGAGGERHVHGEAGRADGPDGDGGGHQAGPVLDGAGGHGERLRRALHLGGCGG